MNHVDVLSLARELIAEFDKSQARIKIFPPDVLVNLRGVGKAIDTVNNSRSDSLVFVDKLFAVRLKNKPLVAEVSESRELIAIVCLAETVADGSGNEISVVLLLTENFQRIAPVGYRHNTISCTQNRFTVIPN